MSNWRSGTSFENHPSLHRYAPPIAPNRDIRGDHSGNSGSHNIANSNNITSFGNTTYNNYSNPEGTNSAENDARILQTLYTSDYRSHQNRVREPVKGTCIWVTQHQKYQDWLGKDTSGLLWLSADPGYGKSVTASFLINHLKSQTDATVCYFFLKDDSDEQKSATFALCAILHQLFVKRRPLCKYAKEALEAKGTRFTGEVESLWEVLVKAVADEGCGDVICVVDALDECEERTRTLLIRHLTSLPRPQPSSTSLKFLVTSRPYYEIARAIGTPATTIRLKGEDEVKAISADVTRVIDDGIKDLESYWGRPGGLGFLRNLLESSADRTFLWISLVLDLLKDCGDDSREGFANIASTCPRDLTELYTKILDKSKNPDAARRILHIVVAAARPLTLREINVAFRIRRGHTSTGDLGDLSAGSETAVKNLCGLFVRIIDSKVYLVHQTAKEFLVKGTSRGQGNWQYTLCPMESNFILADICISYLSLQVFENDPLVMDPAATSVDDRKLAVPNHIQKYALLDYGATYWADHFRDSQKRQMDLFELTQQICKRGSNIFLTWLGVYWEKNGQYLPFPNDFTHLMIASWLGQRKVVKRLLKEKGDINAQSKGYGTALNVATQRSDRDISKILVKRRVNAYIGGKEYNILLTRRGELDGELERLSRRLRELPLLPRGRDVLLSSLWREESLLLLEERLLSEEELEEHVIKFLKPFCIQGIRDLYTLPSRFFYSLR